MNEPENRTLKVVSWAMYDMANQFFALNIVSLYFVRWITLEKGAPEIFYSLAFGVSTFFIAALAPMLGTIADIKHKHREFLIIFTMLCIVFTMLLGITDNMLLALVFFGIANIGCQEAVIFYNSLMLTISPEKKIGLVSGLGKMFGYFGAIVALLFTKPLIINHGYQPTFILTGILFFILALPCMIFVKDTRPHVKHDDQQRLLFDHKSMLRQLRPMEVFKRLKTTLFGKEYYWGLREFLKAGFFGLCVVNVTILFMSIYATKVFGLNDIEIINFVAFSTVFAIIGSISSGIISDYIGYQRTMLIVFFLWILCLFFAALAIRPFHWIIGILAGLSLGATWVVSRALVVNIVPKDKTGEAFGLFNLVGYLAGFFGPLIWGVLLLLFRSWGTMGYRVALLCLIPFLLIACIFLIRIPNYRPGTIIKDG